MFIRTNAAWVSWDYLHRMKAEEVMAAYGEAWTRGDPDAAFSFYAENVVMRLPGRGELAGKHQGRDAVINAVRTLLERTSELTAEVHVVDRLVSGNRVALLLREAAVRGDDRVELRRVNVYTVKDDQIVEIDIFEANQYEVDEFFG